MTERDLTEAQDKWLRRAHQGRIVYNGPRGYGRSAWERCMISLQAKGYVTPNAWGEYDLTDKAQAALRSTDQAKG